MKKKLSNANKLILSTVLCTVLLISGFFVSSKFFGDKIKSFNMQNNELQTEYDTLQAYIINKSRYIAETDTANAESLEIISSYPSSTNIKNEVVKFEKLWDGLVGDVNNNYGFFTTSISVSPEYETVAEMSIDGNDYYGNTTQISVAYRLPYGNFKQMMHDLADIDRGLAVTEITMSPDEQSREIAGSINFVKCTIAGSNVECEEPSLDIETGVDALFFSGDGYNPDTTDSFDTDETGNANGMPEEYNVEDNVISINDEIRAQEEAEENNR